MSDNIYIARQPIVNTDQSIQAYELHHNKKRSHEAAFVGLLSLMHCIVHLPIEKILDELHVDKEINEAITEHKGELGALLELAVAVEEFHLEDADTIVRKLKISQESFREALIKSMHTHTDEDD